MLRIQQIIRPLITGFLLLLLVLGNTPRLWLHDLFATHSGCMTPGGDLKGKVGMQPDRLHCRHMDVVIESPFIEASVLLLQPPSPVFPEIPAARIAYTLSGYTCRSGLRGPPAAAC